MAETIKCKCCEKEIPNDSVFCPFCGAKQKTKEFKFWKSIKNFHLSLKTILITIAAGVWVIVFQNMGARKVKVDNEVEVCGNVNVKNTVDANVSNTVDAIIRNTVDINIQEINGYRSVFFNNPGRGEKDKYYVLPVTIE